jgi:hypothetical protein
MLLQRRDPSLLDTSPEPAPLTVAQDLLTFSAGLGKMVQSFGRKSESP